MRKKFFHTSAFTILEILLVLVIVAVLATLTGSAYYSAIKNARVEQAAHEISAYIQEARSLAIDNKNLDNVPGRKLVGYAVTVKNQTDNILVRFIKKVSFPDGTTQNLIIKEFETKSEIIYEPISSTPAGFSNTAFEINYYLPSGNMELIDSGISYIALSFRIKDNLTNRAVRFDLNTISGLLETKFE